MARGISKFQSGTLHSYNYVVRYSVKIYYLLDKLLSQLDTQLSQLKQYSLDDIYEGHFDISCNRAVIPKPRVLSHLKFSRTAIN